MKPGKKKIEKAKKLSIKYTWRMQPIERLHPGEMLCDGTVYEGTKNKLYTGIAKKHVKAMKKNQKEIRLNIPLNIHIHGDRIGKHWTYISDGFMLHDSGEMKICFN